LTPTPEAARVFDRPLVRRRRRRAAVHLAAHDFLFREVAERLFDRLDDIRRTFPLAAVFGPGLERLMPIREGRGGIERLIACDNACPDARGQENTVSLIADEELLPFAPETLDLVLGLSSLHWVNDLPGALSQINRALKPDGFFLGAMFGGETLRELRDVLMRAELAETGGVSPRVSPFADLRDMAGLLQRAGFALPVADLDTITVTYPDMLALMRDLRGMGEANALFGRLRQSTRRAVFAHAAALYAKDYAMPDGRLRARFDVIFMAGWAPHASQQKPLPRGSGKQSLAEALKKE